MAALRNNRCLACAPRRSTRVNPVRLLCRCPVSPILASMTAEPLRGPRLSEGVDLSVNQIPWEVKAVILFGSQARGDDDSASDTDLVAFADVLRAEALAQTHESLRLTWEVEGPEVTLYSTMTAVEMAGEKKLFFLCHRPQAGVLTVCGRWGCGI